MEISWTSQVFISKDYFNIIPIHRFQGNKNIYCRVDFTRVAKQANFWHEQNKKLPGHKQANFWHEQNKKLPGQKQAKKWGG